MSIQTIHPSRRSELVAPLVALVLAVAILVIGAQVSTLFGSGTSAPVRPAPTVFLPASSDASGLVPHLPAGCRPKIGC
jgi:hypothetical protein